MEVAVSPCLIDTPNVDKGALPFTDACIQRLDLRTHPDRVDRMVTLLKEQIANGRSTPGPDLKNDKNVRIIFPKDKRLPAFV